MAAGPSRTREVNQFMRLNMAAARGFRFDCHARDMNHNL